MNQDLSNINDDPLQYFNAILQDRIAGLDDSDIPNEVALALLAISGHPQMSREKPIDTLINSLDGSLDYETVQQIGACLMLALWKLDNGWISDSSQLRPRVMTLFERHLTQILKDLKLDTNKQTHEKINDLVAAVADFDMRLQGAISELTSLDRVRSHIQSMNKTINNRFGKFMLKPFLPEAYNQELNEIYKRIERYIETKSTLAILDTYDNVISALDQLADSINGTYYGNLFLSVLEKLRDLLKQDFETNKAAQPANLIIERNTKKYPFEVVGHQVDLTFTFHNEGTGYAYDVSVEILSDESIQPLSKIILRRIGPNSSQSIQIPAKVVKPAISVGIMLTVTWRNYGVEEEQASEFLFDVESQKGEIDWLELERMEPYPLSPVTTRHDLVGRNTDINTLIALTHSPNQVGSAYVTGQKRVGKTSLAKALVSHLEDAGYITIYLEGDYIQSTPESTIQYLGRRLCRLIKRKEPALNELDIPHFEADLSPLRDFLDDAIDMTDRRIVIILDEFDEIPPGLYSHNDLATAFFMALRNTSSREPIGFVLVGGEKMDHIFQSQGMHLNKWKKLPVDYFDYNSDYRDLIQLPVQDILEFNEEALRIIYDVTAGNPYFTKQLCGFIFSFAIDQRDCYITEFEVERAIQIALSRMGSNTFQHFWDDGIDKRSETEEEKRERRRRVLIALCDLMTDHEGVAFDQLVEHKLVVNFGRALIESELKEFVQRKVLVSKSPGHYSFKVPLFQSWLQTYGTNHLLASFSGIDIALRERIDEEEIRVKPQEITALLASWDSNYYRGRQITSDTIRSWLAQFEALREQRAMFTVLTGMKFYSDGFVRHKIKEGHESKVVPNLVRTIKKGQQKRADILVSYLVGVGKSGADLARMYATDCSILIANVVEREKLEKQIQTINNLNAIVFVDDFIGTGTQLAQALEILDDEIGDVVLKKKLRVVCMIVAATSEGYSEVERTLENLRINIELFVGEIVNDEDMCFHPESKIFASNEDREYARLVAKNYGERLSRTYPLGFKDQGLAVTFETSCPNNSLPILWRETSSDDDGISWSPLFKR